MPSIVAISPQAGDPAISRIYRGIAYCAANGLPLTGKGGAVETVEWDMEHVKRSLFTPEAGEMAKDGLEFMRAFALRLRAETENIREV